MTHDAAVRTIVKLVPEIEKQGAERVLRDYAVSEDLPPAQLEKLAQVFNTLRTVSHIEKAADRGSSVELVDVPTLVVSYALDMGHTKKALAPVSHSSHAPAQVDLLSAMRSEVAGPRQERQVVKAASAPATLDAADVCEAALHLAVEARMGMSKLASEILTGRNDISGLERDTIHSHGVDAAKEAGDWLQKVAAASRFNIERHDYSQPLTKQAFAVGSSGSAKFGKLCDAMSLLSHMEKFAYPGHGPDDGAVELEDFDPASSAPSSPASALAAAVAKMNPQQRAAYEQAMLDQGLDAGGGKLETEPEASGGPDAPKATDAAEALRSDPDRSNVNGGGGRSSGGGGGGTETTDKKKSGDASGKKSDTTTHPHLLRDMWETAKRPVNATANSVINLAGKVDDTLTKITSKERTNKAQQRTDLSVEDIRRAINIRRMIGTDSVLKESDPREVLEIYNSVARLNPELAGNMPAMKLLLREAVSYEGLTLDAQKQLTDIRKNTSDSEGKEYDNDKRRYAVGGAMPIGITPSRRA